MHLTDEQLEKFFRDSQIVSDSDLEEAKSNAEEKSIPLADSMLELGLITEENLRRVKANILGIPFVDLRNHIIDKETLRLIPEPIARNHNIVAYRKKDDTLQVAMLDADDLAAIDFIKKKTGLKIDARVTTPESIKHALQQYQKDLKSEFGDILEKESLALKTISQEESESDMSEEDLKEIAEELPVVRIVEALIKHAIIQNASDIHIEPMEEQLLVRYRIDGILHDAMVLPKSVSPNISARIKVLANLKLDEKRLPQDGRFKVEADNEKVSFRVSILPTNYGEKTVMRLLRESAAGFTLEGLGFHGESLERIHHATNQRTGMILTTGPTGSGKTTTLYTVLDILNTPEVNISTVEDPIEYQMDRINQTQVKPDIGFDFSVGLRTLVRQDPDIIMVGEVRDQETASLAVNAALTGHLVLSTLHTNSAAGAIPRLIDMKVEPFLIVSTVKVIIGQRLVRKLCKDKEEYNLTPEEIETLRESVDLDKVLSFLKEERIVSESSTWEDIPFYRPKETDECEDGFSGRVGIHEVLKVTETIRNMVMSGSSTEELEEQARKEGMMTMIEDGIFKAAQGETSIEEVLRVISE
ncbi:MAG: GspE/PulE family protein [Candidatus Campbellbacteria bacterium]|nr:GspE/PulE family protein [Candidatus Campbellbacteria bacterium]